MENKPATTIVFSQVFIFSDEPRLLSGDPEDPGEQAEDARRSEERVQSVQVSVVLTLTGSKVQEQESSSLVRDSVFLVFPQETDQVHVLPGGSVRPALHPVCLPARGGQQPGV